MNGFEQSITDMMANKYIAEQEKIKTACELATEPLKEKITELETKIDKILFLLENK